VAKKLTQWVSLKEAGKILGFTRAMIYTARKGGLEIKTLQRAKYNGRRGRPTSSVVRPIDIIRARKRMGATANINRTLVAEHLKAASKAIQEAASILRSV